MHSDHPRLIYLEEKGKSNLLISVKALHLLENCQEN